MQGLPQRELIIEISFWRNWARGTRIFGRLKELQQICLWELDRSSGEFISICPWLCIANVCVWNISHLLYLRKDSRLLGLDCLSGPWRTHSPPPTFIPTQPPSDIYPPNYIKSQHTIDELSASYEQTVAGDLTPLKTLDQCLYLFTCNGMALW